MNLVSSVPTSRLYPYGSRIHKKIRVDEIDGLNCWIRILAMFVHFNVCIHAYGSVYMHVYMYICIYLHILNIYTYYVCVCVHVCRYIHMYAYHLVVGFPL